MMLNPDGALALRERPMALPSETVTIETRFGTYEFTPTQTVVMPHHREFTVFTNESISQIENVDVAAAVARLSIDQTFLEASYMLTARLSQLTLANFLR